MMDTFRGVNLGGWLVLERWISPSVFEGTDARDEHTLCLSLGPKTALRRLSGHRDSFITGEHLKRLAALGITTVRLPVGYWLFNSEDGFIGGGDTYVDRLFVWAKRHGLGIVLCLHGAPGSQNGWDHSGSSGRIGWPQSENVSRSLNFLSRLCKQYGNSPQLVGVEPLNEPHWDIPMGVLIDYYAAAGRIIESLCHNDVAVILHDAFRYGDMVRNIQGLQLRRQPLLDVHMYQLYTEQDRKLDLNGHMKKTNREWQDMLLSLTRVGPVIVGEWSAAMDELYDPLLKSKARNYQPEDYRQYVQAQIRVFKNTGVGWFYWTARTEDRGIWSLLDHDDFV